MVRFFIACFIAVCTCLCGDCSPMRSAVAGRSIVEQSAGQDVPAYIEDGLHFFAEDISSTDYLSGAYQYIRIPALPTGNGWTLEVVGDFSGMTRQVIILGFDERMYSTYPNPFGIGWWISSNGQSINFRYSYHEPATWMSPDGVRCLAYTIDGNGSNLRYFAEGELVNYVKFDGTFPSEINAINGQPMNILSLRIYDRQLSDEEVAYNHAIDVERFGL